MPSLSTASISRRACPVPGEGILKPTRQQSVVLGLATCLVFTAAVILLLAMSRTAAGTPDDQISAQLWVSPLITVTALALVCLTALYIGLVLRIPAVRVFGRTAWIIIILFGTFAGMAAFWIIHFGRNSDMMRVGNYEN